MKDSIATGLECTSDHLVTEDMSPPHLPVKLLSTPSMIKLIEINCLMTVQYHLDENETTVGTHICVSHEGKALPGENVTITTRLTKINKRRLTFDITVDAPSGCISTGTVEKAVINLSRFKS